MNTLKTYLTRLTDYIKADRYFIILAALVIIFLFSVIWVITRPAPWGYPEVYFSIKSGKCVYVIDRSVQKHGEHFTCDNLPDKYVLRHIETDARWRLSDR